MSTQVNVIQNDNQLTVNSVYNTITVIDNNREGHIVEVIQPISNVVTINTGFAGVAGPVGPAGPTGSSIPFSNKGGDVWFTTSSIEITGSFTVSGSNTFKNIGPAIFSGSINISGSTIFTGSVQGNLTGSLLGTASYASQALTASYALNVIDTTFPYTGSAIISGSLAVTGSTGISSTLNVGGQATFNSFVQVGSTLFANLNPTWTIQNTANPGSLLLQSRGSAFNNFMFHTNGYFGINQLSPSMSLDVSGSGRFTENLYTTGSVNITGSIVQTGSLRILVTGSSLINLGNAVTTSQRLLRIGQDTSWLDLGSSVTSFGSAAIYFNQSVPSNTNYGIRSDGSGMEIQAPSTGGVLSFRTGATNRLVITGIKTTGSSISFNFTPSDNTNQDFSVNTPNFRVLGVNKQWATGDIQNQYWNYFTSNTSSFIGTSTITSSYTVFIEESQPGTNSSHINNYALGLSGSLGITGSIKAFVTGSNFINLGNAATNGTSLGILRVGQGTTWLDFGQQSAGVPAIWMGKTPSSTNMSLYADSTSTFINAPTSVVISIGGAAKHWFNSTGLRVGSTVAAPSSTLDVAGSSSFSGSMYISGSTYITGSLNILQDTGYITLGSLVGATSFGAIYINKATPSVSNYSLISDANETMLNGVTNVYLRTSNGTRLQANSTNVLITVPTIITGSLTASGSLNLSGSQLNWGDLTVNAGNIKITTSGSVDEYISFNRAGSNGWASGRSNTGARYIIAYNSTGDATLTSSEYLGISNTGDVTIGKGAPISGSLIVSGSTILSGSSTTITGSLLAYVTGSDFINLGNATPNPSSNLGILRIGQHTSVIDMGYIAGSQAAIWVQKTTPTTTNYTITADAATTIFNGVDNLIFSTAGTERFRVNRPQTSGVLSTFNFASVSDTGMTAGTNIPKYIFNGGSTQWLAGNLSSQYFFHFRGGTASFASGNNTITNAFTIYVDSTNMDVGATASANYSIGTKGPIYVDGINSIFDNSAGSNTLFVNRTGGTTSLKLLASSTEVQVGSNTSHPLYLLTNATQRIIIQTNTTTGSTTHFTSLPPNNTGQTVNTEIPGYIFTTYGRTWNNGNITTQRDFFIQAPTFSFGSGNATFTNSYNLYAVAPAMGTGATSSANWAAGFEGNVRIIDSSPLLQIGNTNGSAMSIRATSLAFNRNVNTGTIYASGHAYQFQHTPSLDNTLDTFKLQIYNAGGSQLTSASIGINANGELLFIPVNSTARSASIEYPSARFNTANRQWNGGDITKQREFLINGPTYSFASGNFTISSSYNLYAIAPAIGTGVTASLNYAAGFEGATQFQGDIHLNSSYKLGAGNHFGVPGNTADGTIQLYSPSNGRMIFTSNFGFDFTGSRGKFDSGLNVTSSTVLSGSGYTLTTIGSSSFSGSIEILVPTASVNTTPYYRLYTPYNGGSSIFTINSAGGGTSGDVVVGGSAGSHQFRLIGNSATQMIIDSGFGGVDNDTYLHFYRNFSTRWAIGKTSTNTFVIRNAATGSTIMSVDYTTGLTTFLSGSTVTGSLNITGSSILTGSLTVSGSASFDGYFQYTTGSNSIILRSTVGVPTYAALYMNVVPSSTNYLITSDGANPGINGTTGIAILTGGTTRINIRSNSLTFTPGVASGAAIVPFNFTSSNNTNQDSGSIIPKFYVHLAETQWLAGNITSSQGFFLITQPTMSFTNQSTASIAATMRLIGGVSASTSASITENAALLIDSGSMGSSTERGYGALIYAPVSSSISNAALGLRGNLIQTGSTYITGSLTITGSASYNNNPIATLPDVRFCVQMGSISFNPADATTYYDGMFIPNNSNHSQGAGKIYIPQNCTLIGYSLTLYNNGGVGTNETSSISCSINNSTLVTLDNVMDVTKFPYTSSASNLNTNINAGDYVELRWTTPTWGTNPVSTAIAATLWFKGR